MESTDLVAIVAGGLSHERDVSLKSAKRVVRDLTAIGVDARMYEADHSLLSRLSEDSVAAALPTMHGDVGEDGALQTVLELAAIPFVGAPSSSCRLAWDKATARALVEPLVNVPQWVALPSATFREFGSAQIVDLLVERLGLPLVVKPNRGGSVLGVSGVTTADELPAALMRAYSYGSTAVIEHFFEGLDISVAVIEKDGNPVALPPIGLHYHRDHQFDFAARYEPALIDVESPAKLADSVTAELQQEAVLAHQRLGLRDLSRSDFILASSGEHVMLETAITPGMTETSLFPFACEAAASTLALELRELLETAISRQAFTPR